MIFRRKKKKKYKKEEKKEAKKTGKLAMFFLMLGTGKEREYLVENFSMLVSSGINISIALESVEREMKTAGMKKTLQLMREEILGGSSIWRAMEKSGIFPRNAISLTKIGEESGRLPQNLKVIAIQEQKEKVFRSKIRSAMMYPVLVLSLTLFVGIGIAWFILPRLATVFSQMKIDLPAITKILIATGIFLKNYGTIAIPVFLFVVGAIIFFTFSFSKTKFIGQRILFSFPAVKKLIQETEMARFGFLLGTLLESGMPVTVALESLSDITSFRIYKNFYGYLKKQIEEGNSFKKSFSNYKKIDKLIPNTIQQMVVAGEQSGNLSEILVKIGQIFEEKTDTTTKNLTVILEPILLVIVWLGVVAVALAVILPIYSLIGGLNSPKTVQPAPPPVTETVEMNNGEPNEGTVGEEEILIEKKLEIKETGTGLLNVRDNGNTKGKIIGKVLPQEQYVFIEEKEGWYRIILADNTEGWVKGEYVQIIQE